MDRNSSYVYSILRLRFMSANLVVWLLVYCKKHFENTDISKFWLDEARKR